MGAAKTGHVCDSTTTWPVKTPSRVSVYFMISRKKKAVSPVTARRLSLDLSKSVDRVAKAVHRLTNRPNKKRYI